MFAISLEGFRRTWDFKTWWREYLGQCWFIAKVCSIPVVLISIPFGAVIALHVGTFSRQLGAESTTGPALVLAIVQLGSASCRHRMCPSVSLSVVVVPLKTKTSNK